MPSFHHAAVEIAYLDQGRGDPIVLVHGFASTKESNWVNPGWVDLFTRAGRRVIALDNRGHGQSTKLYAPEDYHLEKMGGDVRALMDHLGILRADVVGYSLGARITALVALRHAERTRSAVLGGIGINMVTGLHFSDRVVEALLAPSRDAVTDPVGRAFRIFAEQTHSDLRALAACMPGSRQLLTGEEAAQIRVPTLVAVGTKDTIAGSGRELAQMIPGAQMLDIPNRDHMLAVGDRVFKQGAVKFLSERP